MSLWSRLKAAIEGEATSIEATLSEFEKENLPKAIALLKQIESTIGQQGMTIIEQAIGDLTIVVESGGNLGAAITAVVPQVISQVKEDLQADAKTAAYGAASIILASRGPVNTAVSETVANPGTQAAS